jgi:hypothetical protein
MKPIKNVKVDVKKVKLSKSKKSTTRKTVNPKKRSSEPIDDIEDTSAVIAEEEDEEIDEDEAFNSEDERKWGAVFPRSKSKTILEDAEEDDDEDLGIPFQSRRKTHKNDIKDDDDDDDEDEEEKEEEEEDIGLTLEDMLDASLAADAAKKGIKKKNASKNQQEESTSNKKMKTKILARTIKRKREPTEHVDEEDEEEEEEENADGEFLSDDQRKRIFDLLKSTSSSSSSLSTVKEMSLKRKKTNRGSRGGGHIAESGGFGPEGEFAAAQVQAIKAAKGLLKEAKDSQGIENESGVDIGGLVSALSGTAGYSSLKSKLERLVGKSLDSDSLLPVAPVPLKAPPTKEISDKATRVESYDHVSRLVGNRWTDLVSLTRQAPSISFSAEAGVDTRKTQTTASMAASFTPSNEFEVKIAAALAASGMGALPGQAVIGALSSSTRGRKRKGRGNTAATGDKAVLEAEQGELAELQSRLGGDDENDDENGDDDDDDDDHLEGDFEGDDLKEAPANAAALKARQRTLQRMRALLFFDEIKKRRINKVKSKTFRRLRKKADTKAGAIEIERLQDEDPEAARALEDAEARIIAKERASLKHRSSGRGVGGSKWIKRVLARGGGGGNSESHLHNKAELIALQQREEALRAKIRGIKSSTNDEEEDDDEEDDNDNNDDDDGSMSAADILAQGRASILKIATEAEDGTSNPRKGLFGMRFMSQAVDRAKAAAKDAGELEAASMARHEDILRSDSGVGRGNSALGGWSLDDYEDDDALQEEDAAIAQDEERNDDDFSSGNVASEEGHIDNKPESALSILRKTRAATKAKLEADSAKVASGSTVGRFTFQGKSSSKNGNGQNKINDEEEEENENEEDRPTSGLSKHATQKAMAEVRAIAAATSSSTSNSKPIPKLITSSNTKSSTSLSSSTSSTDAAAVSENPWLAASFSSGLGGRHIASKRATQAALEASKSLKNSNSAVIDVASAISAIQADADANTLKKAKAKKKVSYELLNSNEQSFLQASSSSSITSTKKRSLSTSVVNQQDSDGVLRDTKRVKKEKFMKKDNQNDNDSEFDDNVDDNADDNDDDNDDDERGRGKDLRSNMDQATLVRAAFVDAGADMNADDSIEAEKLREERERIEDNVAANKRGKGRAGRGKDTSSASAGWGSWTGLGASVAIETKTNGEKRNPSRVTLSASASAILASKKSDLLRIEQERESETPSQKAARIEVQRRKDAGLTGVFISEKRDKKLAQSHQAPTVPHPFPNKEAYEASMRHPLGREWNTMAATAAFTKPEWTTKAGLIIQPIRPANIKRDGKGPEEARKHVPSIGNIGQGKKSSKHR